MAFLSAALKKNVLYRIVNLDQVSLPERTRMMQNIGGLALVLVAIWLYSQLQQSNEVSQLGTLCIALLFGIFSIIFWISVNRLNQKIISQNSQRRILPNKDRLAWIYILTQYACILTIHGLTAGQFNNDYILAIMLTIISPQLMAFSQVVGFLILLSTTTIYILITNNPDTLIMGLYFILQQLVVWGFSLSTSIELAAKNQLQMLNGELNATQQMLAKTIRQNERLRISRDLHDQTGHHLAALSINLQASSLKLGKQTPIEIEQSVAITKSMLMEVRQIVGDLRDDDNENFIESVSTMVKGIPRLQVALDIADDVEVRQHKQVDCLLRCIQESITNILKHSSANKVSIKIRKNENNLQMIITDNGISPVVIRNGNGIKGMQERLSEFMGSLSYHYIEKTGVQAVIELPEAA